MKVENSQIDGCRCGRFDSLLALLHFYLVLEWPWGNRKSPWILRKAQSPFHGALSTRQGSARGAKQPHYSLLDCPNLHGKKAAKKHRAQLRTGPSHWWWGGWSDFSHFKPGTGLISSQETPEGSERWLKSKKKKNKFKKGSTCVPHSHARDERVPLPPDKWMGKKL